ncbi:M81 family metallopeptidase [Aneurinibacillus sp. REN35]|uniref:M81 family metallopeptidase n=1 Tax=Aneurinibacillus sp. REN35 TaxID=3237286 RepID=UPI0035270C54
MNKKRVGIAFFYHESHTFSSVKTDIQSFRDEGYYKGGEIIAAYKGTKTEVGGFIHVLEEEGATIVPLVCAAAIPSGIVTDAACREVQNEIIEHIQKAGRLDGLLLALHGAMVAEEMSDPEGELLVRIRQVFGDELPIATTLDMHANVSHRLVAQTPLHFGFKTYPHVDMYEQGCRAAAALLQQLEGNHRCSASFIKLPMMPPSINMRTEEGPMHELIESGKRWEREEGIVSVNVFGGFPYADIEEVGASIIVVATHKEKGDMAAASLAKQFWGERHRFLVDLPGVEEAVSTALAMKEEKPVVLADISDNPLSGGSGDTTSLLREMLQQNVKDALFGMLYDPISLAICMKAGEGKEVSLLLGGKCTPEFGGPIPVTAEIIRLTDGRFTNKGPMNTGMLIDMKGAAHLRVHGLDILLTGRALSANDPEMFRHIGIEPTEKKILGLKVKNHFRAAFDPLVSHIIYVDAPGIASNQLKNFTYHRIPRPIWPLDDMESYEPNSGRDMIDRSSFL